MDPISGTPDQLPNDKKKTKWIQILILLQGI